MSREFQFGHLKFNLDDSQISSQDAKNGNVKVEAKAPSGRVHDMGVSDASGVYTANFTPTEVGDWLISILYEGQHIQGSPFNVRVYDATQVKVFGLEGGTVGKTFHFSVDATGAGEGQLTVDITHGGRTIPAQIVQDGPCRYKIAFTPDGGGIYNIRVFFAGMEVAGSPYTLEIIDSSAVSASGEGLSTVEVNRRATFIVNTGQVGSGGDVKVNVTSPRGGQIPAQIYNNGDGTFRVEYTPNDVGEYLVDVFYYGKPIPGSPYRVQAFDWSRITIRNLRNHGMVNRVIEFDIDASHAGSGNLEIMVNDGTIPCSVQNRGNRQFHASFMPKEAVPHYIQMRFNGRDVPGSPWSVDIKSAAHVTATGQGLQVISSKRLATFEVRTGSSDGNVTCNITSPKGRNVPARVINQHDGSYRIEYTPMEVGTYVIDVMFEAMAIPGSPYHVKAYDTGSIAISPIPNGMVGKPSEFTIDVTRAGEGQLEIMVNRGAVPNSVRMLSKGVFLVSFVPREARAHQVEVKFNGEPLPNTPINVPVLDTSRVTVQGDGLRQVAVNRQSFFRVQTQAAGEAELTARVTSPTNRLIPTRISGAPHSGFDVEFSPNEVGTHQVEIEYGGVPIPNSPFLTKVYDVTKVMVHGIKDSVVGKATTFMVDVNEAGEGNMEISITGSSGQNIQNHVRQVGQGRFEVNYTPQESGHHRANVTFNREHVQGSPYQFNVTDASKLAATGDGLGLVPANKPTMFTIMAPGASRNDLDVKITDPSGRDIIPRVFEQSIGMFTAEYTPTTIGDYIIGVTYFGKHISGSPYQAKAWDASKVLVSSIVPGRINRPSSFNIDASRAGAGNLEIIVSVCGENVPNFVKTEGNANFAVSYTPQLADTHMISIKFNGEMVPGSPFHHCIIDGTRATAAGQGLNHVSTNRMAFFDVRTNGLTGADVAVQVISPNGRNVACRVTSLTNGDFKAEYLPVEVGHHEISVKYADAEITGSPFSVEAFDPNKVQVGTIESATLGRPCKFSIDTSAAGKGDLRVEIRGQMTNPEPTIQLDSYNRYNVTFEPMEGGRHYAIVHYGDEVVKGSPFPIEVLDVESLSVNWEVAKNSSVFQPVSIDLNGRGLKENSAAVKVTDPYGRNLGSRVLHQGQRLCVEYTPKEVGPHTVEIMYGGQHVQGSPFTANVFDASSVRLLDLSSMPMIGHEASFKVDTSTAGAGELDVQVTCDGRPVGVKSEKLDNFVHQYTFTPASPRDHLISVMFNSQPMSGSPKQLSIQDPRNSLSTSNAMPTVAVGKMANSLIRTRGLRISLKDVQIQIIAPNGDQVPAKIVQQPDGDYKVEYSSKYTGRHTVEILYAGQAIMGSPFYVEIYDPNKIRVEGTRRGMANQKMDFDIIRHEAGRAELGLSIVAPNGRNVPYEINMIPGGDHVTYMPTEPGPHQIYITYGGLDVPGCPIRQEIIDSGSATAHGEGLEKGFEDKPSSFYVDSKGHRGELVVQVEGPNSIAKCNIEPDTQGRYLVTYVPVEVGKYKVSIKWNGREIERSPFHPSISDPRKVRPIGGWDRVLDANRCLVCRINESKNVEFDARQAGPGRLTCKMRGPNGPVNVNLNNNDGIYLLSFVPTTEGEYQADLFWNDMPIPNSPMVCIVKGMPAAPVNHDKVILTGHGLREARLKEEAEFVIDGTEAGPGTPMVTLSGVKMDIDVRTTQIGDNKYRCTYVPQYPGAYLLNIQWSDRQVRGSPFKVNVVPGSDASKVVCDGEGLRTGIMGREIKAVIDTRKAGPGELTAHCMGPAKVAFCELIDHRDGQFTLNVKPQEAGKHVLQIKFGGEHVPGSPFHLKVAGAPDPSKVVVRGPGIEHGILATYQSRFTVETRGAGAGQLTVRIRGPKGAFRVEMQRESQRDRTILCRYDPTEVGDYILHIKWSGEHVPGSPFRVQIFDTQEELERFLINNPHQRNNALHHRAWNEDL